MSLLRCLAFIRVAFNLEEKQHLSSIIFIIPEDCSSYS